MSAFDCAGITTHALGSSFLEMERVFFDSTENEKTHLEKWVNIAI